MLKSTNYRLRIHIRLYLPYDVASTDFHREKLSIIERYCAWS